MSHRIINEQTDPDSVERFRRLCRMQNEFWKNMPPAEKDRLLQIHLAEARGPRNNFKLFFELRAAMDYWKQGRKVEKKQP